MFGLGFLWFWSNIQLHYTDANESSRTINKRMNTGFYIWSCFFVILGCQRWQRRTRFSWQAWSICMKLENFLMIPNSNHYIFHRKIHKKTYSFKRYKYGFMKISDANFQTWNLKSTKVFVFLQKLFNLLHLWHFVLVLVYVSLKGEPGRDGSEGLPGLKGPQVGAYFLL